MTIFNPFLNFFKLPALLEISQPQALLTLKVSNPSEIFPNPIKISQFPLYKYFNPSRENLNFFLTEIFLTLHPPPPLKKFQSHFRKISNFAENISTLPEQYQPFPKNLHSPALKYVNRYPTLSVPLSIYFFFCFFDDLYIVKLSKRIT